MEALTSVQTWRSWPLHITLAHQTWGSWPLSCYSPVSAMLLISSHACLGHVKESTHGEVHDAISAWSSQHELLLKQADIPSAWDDW